MSKMAMLAVLTRIEADIKNSSQAYRTLVSNYEVHDIEIDEADIIKQVSEEMAAREGLGRLTKGMQDIIDTEVRKLCKTLYNEFHPSNYNSTKFKWTISTEFVGNPRKFSFVLTSKPGKSANVFNTFKKIKQVAQKPLITALNKKIKELNRGSSDQRELIAAKKGFLDIGHREGSSVSLQRAAKAQKILWDLDKKTSLSPLARKVISELSAPIEWEITRNKVGPPKDTIGISLESKALNRDSISKGEVINLNAKLKEVADKIGSEWAEIEGSDSPIRSRQKAVVRALTKPLKGNKNIKVTGASSKPNKSKSRKVKLQKKGGKAQAKHFTDKAIGKTATRKRGTGVGSSPLALLVAINKELPQTVRKNMQLPALENRTGRFAESVKLTDISQTARGFPSIGYTYQRDPYQVFETGSTGNWSSPERDPRRLIDKSIREIAAQYAIGRFYTRRM